MGARVYYVVRAAVSESEAAKQQPGVYVCTLYRVRCRCRKYSRAGGKREGYVVFFFEGMGRAFIQCEQSQVGRCQANRQGCKGVPYRY